MTRNMLICIFLALLVSLSGCFPKDIKETSEKMPERVKSVTDSVNRQAEVYKNLEKAKDFGNFLKLYAEREQWKADIDKAQEKAKLCGELQKQLQAIVKDSDEKKVQEARTIITRFSTAVKEAREFAAKPMTRVEFLRKVKKEAPEMMQTAKAENTKIASIIAPLTTFVAKYRNDFPNKDKDIATRFSPSEKLSNDAKAAFAVVDQEFKSKPPDYAKFGDSCKIITANLKALTSQDKALRAKLAELSTSYSKILVDMRTEPYITIGRCSWDDYSDWNTDKNYSYPAVKLDFATFDYFTKLPDGQQLATWGIGWGSSLSVKINKAMWDKLRISPKQGWPGGHDEAEYWIEDWFEKCYHKYIIEKDGKKTETGFIEVDDEDFADWADDLGMEIVSKPYGYFEDEVMEESAPPGLSKVGDPKYGKWEKDPSTGKERWSWLETYMWYHLMFGGSNNYYYGRSEYTDYRTNYRGKSSYYGGKTSPDKYGTRSRATQAKYSSSTFARSGGMKRQTTSVRSAGRSTRGGGPSRGGK